MNSGRISKIKTRLYKERGTSQTISGEELEKYIAVEKNFDPISDSTLEKILRIKEMRGMSLTVEESHEIEYKESFSMKNFDKALKTVGGFANNQGGYIIFGIKDQLEVVGIEKEHFEKEQPQKFDNKIREMYGQNIIFEKKTYFIKNKCLGIIYVYSSSKKPIIAIKNKHDIKQSEIYYRSHAQTVLIQHTDLHEIIEERIKKEGRDLLKMIEQIIIKGTGNTALLTLDTGEIQGTDGSTKITPEELSRIKQYTQKNQIGQPIVVTKKSNLLDEYPYNNEELFIIVEKRIPHAKKNIFHSIIKNYKIKYSTKYAEFSFRNAKDRKLYEETRALKSSTASIYNDAAADYIVSIMKKMIKINNSEEMAPLTSVAL